MPSDFITRYTNLLKGDINDNDLNGITDAPEEFQEASAIFLLSSAVGRRWIFFSIPEMPLFHDDGSPKGKFLNLWFCLIGKTRVTRKTKGVLNRVKELMTYLDLPVISNSFSASYLVTELSKFEKEGEVHACSILDECSGKFEHLKGKTEYVIDADVILSTLYDGEDYRRGTQARGDETIRKPYVTIMEASTDYLPKLFSDAMFQQGYLNRYIIIPAKRKNRKSLRTNQINQTETQEIEYVKKFLKALKKRDETVFINLNSEAKKIYNDYEASNEDEIVKGELGLKEGYFGNLPNTVLRLACLFRISRMTIEEIENYRRPFLIVEKQDVQRAIAYGRKIWKWFETVWDMRDSSTGRDVITMEKYERRILQVYAKLGKDSLPQNILRRSTAIRTKDLVEALEGIAEMNFIETGGRKRMEWKLVTKK